MLAHDIHHVLAVEQRLEQALQGHELAAPGGKEHLIRAIERSRGIDQADLWDGCGPVAEGLPLAAEAGHLGHDGELPLAHGAVATLREIRLEAAAQCHHDRRFLLELLGGLGAEEAVEVAEAPGHQVPGFPLKRHAAAFDAGAIETIGRRIVSGDEVHVDGHLLGHHRTEGPVARDLKAAVVAMHLVDVAAQVAAESLAAEFRELVPAGICSCAGNRLNPGLLLESLQDGLGVVAIDGPTLAVDPYAIDVVCVRQLLHLWDQELIHVRTEDGGQAVVAFALLVDASPLWMLGHGLAVPDTRIMHEEADALLGGDLPPDPQRIADKARRGGAHAGGIAGESGMPLAVDLHVVGPHGLEQPLDALARGALAHLLAVGAGVKVEVHAQEALAALQPRWVLRRREAHALGRRVFSRCGQGWHKDHRDQQTHSRMFIAHVCAPDPPVRALVSME